MERILNATLLLLGGGSGQRMGGNKLFLAVDGVPLLAAVAERTCNLFGDTVLCVGHGERAPAMARVGDIVRKYDMSIVEDRAEGRGPLEGLRQGLAAMRTEWGFLLGVDMPCVQEAVVRQMWATTPDAADVTIARQGGRLNALHAFYRATCLARIDGSLNGGARTGRGGAKILSFLDNVAVNVVEETAFAHLPGYRRSFENCNTRAELRSNHFK